MQGRGGPRASRDLRARTAAAVLRVVPAEHPDAQEAMRRYFAELAERFGFDPAGASHDGPFVVALDGAQVIAGGGLRTLPDGRAEVKRMWVDPERRGAGLGGRLLGRLEALAADTGHDRVVLDTNSALTEAVALYDRAGFARIARYNDNPHAQLWFEKHLG